MTAYLPRELTPRLLKALKVMPIVVLSGLRQTGKSTLLQNERELAAGRPYRTLDDFATLAAVLAYKGGEAVKLDGKLFAIPLGHLLS